MRHEQARTIARRRGLATAVGAVVVAMAATLLPAPALAASTPPPRRIVTGWLPYWTSATSTASVIANADLFSDVSPFWYSARKSGSTTSLSQQVSNASKSTFLPQLQAAGIRVLPSITDGMGAHGMATTIASTSTRTAFVNQIVSLVMTNGYDGIDLDFEGFAFNDGRSTWPTTRPNWVRFVNQLAAALHTRGKLLSVTTGYMLSPTSGYWVYDWAGIGASIDRLRVMTYDYHVAAAGPIAPFSWVNSVAKFAASQVPSGKVQIGVASYGRDWRTATAYSGVLATCPTTGPRGASAAQSLALANALSFSKVTHTFTAGGAGSYVAGFTSGNFTAPGVSLLKAPVPTWDSTNKERTFSTQVRFSGRANQSVSTAVAAAAGATTVAVASTAGLATGLSVTGTGIPAGTTVTAVNATAKTVTLSAATTAAVKGTVRFSGLVSAACTISRTAWYDDGAAAAARAALVGTYHLGGIAQWTIGGEDPSQWSKLRSYAASIAPTPTKVATRASSPTAYGQTSTIAVTATAAGLPVAGSTATLQVLSGARWLPVATNVTSASGRVSFSRVVTAYTRYRVVVASTFDRAAGSTQGAIAVKTAVTPSPSYSAVTPGHSSRVIVRLSPARAGQRAVLQVRSGSAWRSISTGTTDRYGRLFYALAPTVRHSTTAYRVAAYPVAGYAGNYGYLAVHLG